MTLWIAFVVMSVAATLFVAVPLYRSQHRLSPAIVGSVVLVVALSAGLYARQGSPINIRVVAQQIRQTFTSEIKPFAQTGPSQVCVDQQDSLARISLSDREIHQDGGLAVARLRAADRHHLVGRSGQGQRSA